VIGQRPLRETWPWADPEAAVRLVPHRDRQGDSPCESPPPGRAAETPKPFVSIITVNFNGRRHLESLLPSLLDLDYPVERREILVVDNGSTDDSAAFVRDAYPNVRVIEAGDNRGFAGGNNLGMRAARGELIALINNDTIADRSWLRELVEVAAEDPRIGIVGSKVLFLTPFLDVRLDTQTFCPARAGVSHDGRELGLMLFEARADGCTYDKTLYRAGCYGVERLAGRTGRWTAGRAELAVPVTNDEGPATLALTLAGNPHLSGQRLRISVGDSVVCELAPPTSAQTLRIDLDARIVRDGARDVINNAGSRLDDFGGYGDRGIYEFDRGQYDSVEDVPALCGVSMLLTRTMLQRIGAFDDRFFMYFEDSDLCWRARRAGYRLVYTPASRLRHVHAGTSEEWSPLFTFYVTRNHLFWQVKHGRMRTAVAAVARLYRDAAQIMVREAPWRPPGGNHASEGRQAQPHLQVARDLTRRLPGLLASRWLGDRRRLAL
jgi:GT2 family glycosyltransferase